jgi:carbon monoxide dehydrogenase subunit G
VRVEGRFEVPVPRKAVWRCIADPALMVMKKRAQVLGDQFAENFRQRVAPSVAE